MIGLPIWSSATWRVICIHAIMINPNFFFTIMVDAIYTIYTHILMIDLIFTISWSIQSIPSWSHNWYSINNPHDPFVLINSIDHITVHHNDVLKLPIRSQLSKLLSWVNTILVHNNVAPSSFILHPSDLIMATTIRVVDSDKEHNTTTTQISSKTVIPIWHVQQKQIFTMTTCGQHTIETFVSEIKEHLNLDQQEDHVTLFHNHECISANHVNQLPIHNYTPFQGLWVMRHVRCSDHHHHTDFNLHIKLQHTGKTLTIPVRAVDTIDHIKALIENKQGIPRIQQRLMFDDREMVVDSCNLLDYGITKESTIHMILRLLGGGSVVGYMFVNLADENLMRTAKCSNQAPDWRIALPGLCIEGTCCNEKCVAHGCRVICNQGYGSFDLAVSTCSCPMCNQIVKPETCGMNNCEWKYEGILESEPEKVCKSDWMHIGNEYVYFDDSCENIGKVSWSRLKIHTIAMPLQTCPICLEKCIVPPRINQLSIANMQQHICQTSYTWHANPGVHLPKCKHFFHKKCISDWFNTSPTCPCCRADYSHDDVVMQQLAAAESTHHVCDFK